jgi:hypothetical protein
LGGDDIALQAFTLQEHQGEITVVPNGRLSRRLTGFEYLNRADSSWGRAHGRAS